MRFLMTCALVVALYMLIFNPQGNTIARNLFKLGRIGVHMVTNLVDETVQSVDKNIVNYKE
jgi:hypothetical protein